MAVGWLWRACGWRSTSRAYAQRQGLWAQWTVVWGGAIGAVRLSSPQRRRVVVAVGGSQPGRSTRSASRASAQREGFPWTQGVSRGGRVPHECGGGRRTFTPLRWCWTVGWCLGRVAVARMTLGPTGDVAWGTLCALLCLGCGRALSSQLCCHGVCRLRRLRHALVRDALGVAVLTRR